MTKPKVSIIVPVFNVQTYLRECLDSILNQTLSEIEIICGDGGSTDGSLEIIQEYARKEARLRYITKRGSGYGQSVNECMGMVQGEYIGIVESDDAVKPETYAVLYHLAKKNDLDWIRGDIYYYYSGMSAGERLKRESIIYGGDFYNTVLDPQSDYRPYKSGLRTWSGIYKTNFLTQNDIRHSETPGGSYQDVGFYLKTLYYARRVYFVNQAFYMWRQDNPGSSVHYNSTKLVEKSLKEWHLNKEYLDSHPDIGKRAVASYHYRKFFSYLWTIDMAEGNDKETVQRIAAEEFTKAIVDGEIDKGFFDEWEWNHFMESLKSWQEIAQENQIQEKVMVAREREREKTSIIFKSILKRMLRPLANPLRKIIHKLMRYVIFALENDINMLNTRINETANDTQWQIRESAKDLQTHIQSVTESLEMIQGIVLQNEQLYKQIENRIVKLEERHYFDEEAVQEFLGKMSVIADTLQDRKQALSAVSHIATETWQKIVDQGDMLWNIKSINENIYGKIAETRQKVLDQGDILWIVKSRNEDIYGEIVDTHQKILDQGDILWRIKSRNEDIHQKVAETHQKSLDQGDTLWSVKGKIEDVHSIADQFLAHPEQGESLHRHMAVNSVLSLLHTGDDQYNKQVCKQFLNHIEIEVFSKCNRKCWFCPNHIIDRYTENHYMDGTLFKKILTELKDLNYHSTISFSRYNEPLADEIIYERIHQARQYCPKARLRFNTNGDYLTPEVLRRLERVGLNEIEVQCYFEKDESFDFNIFIGRLHNLAEKLGISTYRIVTKNTDTRYVAKLDLPTLDLSYSALNMQKLANNRGESLMGITAKYKRTQNCLVPFRNLYIDYNGSYMMCCNVRSDVVEHTPFIIGHAKKERVYDVFCGERMIDIRKRVGISEHLPRPCNSCQYLTCDDDFRLF